MLTVLLQVTKCIEVPPDSGLRVELEKKSIEELREILSTYKNLHNTTDIDTKKRVIRAIEIEHFNHNRSKQLSEFPRFSHLLLEYCLTGRHGRKRISERLRNRLEAGMVNEVKTID